MYKINVNKTNNNNNNNNNLLRYFHIYNAIFTNQGLFKPGYSKQYFFPQLCYIFIPIKTNT